MEKPLSIIDRIHSWVRNSVSLKLIIILFLVILLLIPTSMTKTIIAERQALQVQTIKEVSSKWANEQLITGPILCVPARVEKTNIHLNLEKNNEKQAKMVNLYVLPEQLEINTNVVPNKLSRGLYQVVVYESATHISGKFKLTQLPPVEGNLKLYWEQAFIAVGISDMRGIKNNILIHWNDKSIPVQPGSNIPATIPSGITAPTPLSSDVYNTSIPFNFKLNLQGSNSLSFVPVGGTTHVVTTSTWPAPQFIGSFLPDTRNVTPQGFTAKWQVLKLNRNFPQIWLGSQGNKALNDASFGAGFLVETNDYQKSMRSAKYALLIIGLTFLIFFLIEILYNQRIHPFQYTLVGLSLVLFYVLLLSISEHIAFNLSFIISAVAVIGVITTYSTSVFSLKKHSYLLLATLVSVYSFLFVTLQLTDYALLMGSIGLLLILAGAMYFTRNVDWYHVNDR